jgi:prolyl 4-hydroxylase
MRWQRLHRAPDVWLLQNFVSPAEARELMALADGHYYRSRVTCAASKQGCVDPARTSETAVLPSTPVTRAVMARAEALAGLPAGRAEHVQIVRYTPSQEYKPHLDAFSMNTEPGQREANSGPRGQRAATFLVYLQCPAEGGATVFPKIGLSVRPIAYAAAFWRHSLPNGQLDPLVLHGGAPVIKGIKYAANVWLREVVG